MNPATNQPAPEISAPNPKPATGGLKARLLTAAIGIPLVLLLVFCGGWPFVIFSALCGFLAMRELVFAARAAGTPLLAEATYPLALLLFCLLLWVESDWVNNDTIELWRSTLALDVALLAIPMMLSLRAVTRFGTALPAGLASVGLSSLAIVYVALFAFLPMLLLLPIRGTMLFFAVLLGVWAGDTIAYFAGRALGKRKLTPLSPGKTWVGSLWGLAATFVVVFFLTASALPLVDRAALGIVIGLSAQLGDLVESFWKRELKIKDFGGMLPGHGGILDRCDSLLFAAFAAFVYAVWRILP